MSATVHPVVSTEWLLQNISHPDLVVVDCSWDEKEDMEVSYKRSHIPSTVYLHPLYKTSSSAMYPRPLPDPDTMQPYIRQLGINNRSHVIVYDNNGQCGFFTSGRVWWMLKYFGLAKVSILDGGFQKWINDRCDVTSDLPEPTIGDFIVTLQPSLVVTFEEMEQNLISKDYQIIDTRPQFKYEGSNDDTHSGHYPGAVSIPFHDKLLNISAGVLKTEAEIKTTLRTAGVDTSRPIIVTCNAGMSSGTMLLCADILKFNAKLYVAGMVEWLHKRSDTLVRGNAPL